MMRVAFVSNYLSPHQAPFCEAMNHYLNGEFHFISTAPINRERIALGWSCNSRCSYELRSYESNDKMELSQQMINSSDAVIIGSAPDKMIIRRLRDKKLTFKYAERFYKAGTPLRRLPRDAAAAWLHHGRFQKYPLYMLCASAYTAVDAARFGNYRNRCYKWGYFPEYRQYDPNKLFTKKQQGCPSILWAGRFLKLKHPDDAVLTAAQLKQAGHDFELNIIGTGPMEEQLHQMILERGLGSCVHMLGAMTPEEVRAYMERADIFLVTSDWNEGWGAVLNEAMNSGCAVVASHAVGSTPFLIQERENGLIYKYGELADLFEKVKWLMDKPAEQERLGRNAYHTISDTWNAGTAAHRLLQLIEKIQREGECMLFANGPCSKAEILQKDWFIE